MRQLWMRLLGMLIATLALFFFLVFLFGDGIVARGKGFSHPLIDSEKLPLIDTEQLPQAILCLYCLTIGVCLFIWGARKKKQ